MSDYTQSLRDAAPIPSLSNSSGVAAVRMAADAEIPAEVAANTHKKIFGGVGGVKGTMSPSRALNPPDPATMMSVSSNVTVCALRCHLSTASYGGVAKDVTIVDL
jgi:hypothetical protein